jgi:Ser/Thr protein kinase RdoA (MazF antagonist)
LLLDSYEGVRQLDAAGHSALPMLDQGAAIRFPLTRLF